MKLPTIATPTYTLTLPSTGKEYEFRPYLTKEEKILLLAKESNDPDQMVKALNTVVSNCVNGLENAVDLPVFDLKYIFLQLRSKSSGESVTPNITCSHCKKPFPVEINLDEISVNSEKENHTKNILLTESVGVKMRYPTTAMTIKFEKLKKNSEIKAKYQILMDCIEAIFDNDSVYPTSEVEPEELENFVESLSAKLMETIKEKFFDTMPELSYTNKVTCPHCEENMTMTAESIEDFFI